MSETRILTVSHLAMRCLEDNARCTLEKEQRSDGQWDIILTAAVADALLDSADSEGLTLSDWILQHLRRRDYNFNPVEVG